MTRPKKKPRVFCTISAQHDNLGDIVIRQRMIDMVSHLPVELHVSVASMPADYVAAFTFPANAILYRSSKSFISAFVGSTFRHRTSIVFPPGPYPATTMRGAARGIGSVLLSQLAHLRGGASVTIGKAVRGRHRGAIFAERLLVRSSDIYTSRDRISGSHIGIGVSAVPDLALLAAPIDRSPRQYVVMSFRSDTTTSPDFVGAVADWSRKAGFTPIFVTQVRRDEANHSELAALSGSEHLSWATKSHEEQIDAVMNIYAQATIVVSDRLHSALLGALGGAVPVAVRSSDSPSKIVDALSGVLPCRAVDRDNPHDLAETLSSAELIRDELFTQRAEARSRLIVLQREVRRVISPAG